MSSAQGSQPQDETLFSVEEFGDAVLEDPAAESVFADLAAARTEAASGVPIRLRRIRLANILGFESAEIYPEDFCVLVGANNSGKSSLMRVVSFAQTLLRAHVERHDETHVLLARGRNLDDGLLPVPEVRDLWYGGLRRRGNDWVMAEVELEFETGLVVGFGMKGRLVTPHPGCSVMSVAFQSMISPDSRHSRSSTCPRR